MIRRTRYFFWSTRKAQHYIKAFWRLGTGHTAVWLLLHVQEHAFVYLLMVDDDA
jgi:hypothetical protein